MMPLIRNKSARRIRWLLVVLTSSLIIGCSNETAEKWYSIEDVTAGQEIFANNCANCHGQQGESVENWKQLDDTGKYPPPPLNGSAHAWHHSLAALTRQISDGGERLGGYMPAFKEQLTEQEIRQVIAAMQDTWPDEIYNKWVEIDERSL
jgi:mono/diheme cytochrome c family protein